VRYASAVTALVLAVACVVACSSPSTKPAPPPTSTSLTVAVDRRIELMAVLQRLSGAREYVGTPATQYVAAVDAHFVPFKDHAAVVATRQLRAQYGIGFDGPMWLAVQLDDKLVPRAPPGDARWDKVDITAYLATVRDFVTATGFDAFFAAHRAYFTRVEERLRGAITAENPGAWFDAFFGARSGAAFVVVPAMLVGTHNFGPSTATELFQIIGVVRVDFDELPTFDAVTLELVVHEMAHSYINPLFAKHRATLEPHGTRLFGAVADAMRKQAYPTWDIVLNEQGVRAVTVQYLRERKGAAAADAAVNREVARSFVWTKPLAELLGEYARSRQQYADLDAFMPRIAALFATLP
jgi:Domain of unknown function (DUF4932)